MLETAKTAKAQQGEFGALSSHVNLLMLWTLADLANDKDGQCWHGMPTIANASRLSIRAVQYALKALESDGHITIDKRPGRSSLYSVHPGKTCTTKTVQPKQDVHQPRQVMHPRRQKETPAGGAPEPLNPSRITGARVGVPEGPRAPEDEPATAEMMAELLRALDRTGKALRA